MLKDMPYYRDGVDGLFVGYSEKGGASFVATSVENRMRVITVVLNADQAQEDEFAVFSATNQLLQYLLTNFQKVQVLNKSKSGQVKAFPILDSPNKSVPLVAEKTYPSLNPLIAKLKRHFISLKIRQSSALLLKKDKS